MNSILTTNINDSIINILQNANKKLNLATQRIATGIRINSASDDAANLALSQSIQSSKISYDTYSKNSQMEKTMLQIAESDLSTISSNNQRIRDLAIQASNGIYSSSEHEMIQTEINQLAEENARIVSSSNFNGKNLLDGSSIDVQIMASKNEGVTVEAFKNNSNQALGLDNFDVSTSENASILIQKIDNANTEIATRRASLGSMMNTINSTIDRNQSSYINLSSTQSTIMDTDIAVEMTNLITAKILTEVGVSMQAQANTLHKSVLNLLRTTETS